MLGVNLPPRAELPVGVDVGAWSSGACELPPALNGPVSITVLPVRLPVTMETNNVNCMSVIFNFHYSKCFCLTLSFPGTAIAVVKWAFQV